MQSSGRFWSEAAARVHQSVRPTAVWFWHVVTSTVTARLKYAAALFLLLAARPVSAYALGHLFLADLPHEVEEHLRDRTQVENDELQISC